MSWKVKDVIRELKKFPSDYKVALETYEEDEDSSGGYRVHLIRIVEKDDDANNMVLIK